ncbi:class F sortase [Curtobacterium sp. MCBD17_035]|uniref:class F sortase n=1 Tax=Curtobacterium sp. MCBD17_035 TaxID=2175673 RepID=UPI000DAAAE34|nr:class F sortase [Curtobacterium sp. MCBD17_035]WIB68003.1 class F sortase [Curtobacterium sp. MCBD17_035]
MTDPQADPARRGRRTGRRRPRVLLAAGALAVLMIVGGVGGYFLDAGPSAAGTAVDMRGNAVQLDPEGPIATRPATGAGATTGAGTAAGQEERAGSRFIVRSLDLDVPLARLAAVGGVITPPGFTSAYVVDGLGASLAEGDRGTVFVVMHSLRNGGLAPGNFLIDVARRRASVAPGTVISVGGVEYRVSTARVVPKGRLASTSSIWRDVPGRLVVITCLQRPDGRRSVDNVVIEATRE